MVLCRHLCVLRCSTCYSIPYRQSHWSPSMCKHVCIQPFLPLLYETWYEVSITMNRCDCCLALLLHSLFVYDCFNVYSSFILFFSSLIHTVQSHHRGQYLHSANHWLPHAGGGAIWLVRNHSSSPHSCCHSSIPQTSPFSRQMYACFCVYMYVCMYVYVSTGNSTLLSHTFTHSHLRTFTRSPRRQLRWHKGSISGTVRHCTPPSMTSPCTCMPPPSVL